VPVGAGERIAGRRIEDVHVLGVDTERHVSAGPRPARGVQPVDATLRCWRRIASPLVVVQSSSRQRRR
jgi:hypothetical protein